MHAICRVHFQTQADLPCPEAPTALGSVTGPIRIPALFPGGPLLEDGDTYLPPTPSSTLTAWPPLVGIWPKVPSVWKAALKHVFQTWCE